QSAMPVRQRHEVQALLRRPLRNVSSVFTRPYSSLSTRLALPIVMVPGRTDRKFQASGELASQLLFRKLAVSAKVSSPAYSPDPAALPITVRAQALWRSSGDMNGSGMTPADAAASLRANFQSAVAMPRLR